jgi:hypothetical protein
MRNYELKRRGSEGGPGNIKGFFIGWDSADAIGRFESTIISERLEQLAHTLGLCGEDSFAIFAPQHRQISIFMLRFGSLFRLKTHARPGPKALISTFLNWEQQLSPLKRERVE